MTQSLDLRAAADRLRADPLLRRLPPSGVARLLPYVDTVVVPAGTTLVTAGDPASALFLTLDGSLSARAADGSPMLLPDGRVGDEVLAGMPGYAVTVAADTDATLLRAPRDALAERAAEVPGLRDTALAGVYARMTGARSAAAGTKAAKAAPGPSRRETVGWLAAILLPLAVLAGGHVAALPTPTAWFLAILATAATMWMFSLVDEFVPPVVAIACILAFGLAPIDVALAGFSSNGLLLFVSVYALGIVLEESGVAYRFMLWLLVRVPDGPIARRLVLMASGFAISPVVTSGNSRVSLLMPLFRDMATCLRLPRRSAPATALATATFSGAMLMSPMFLTSKPSNLVVVGMLPEQLQDQFQSLFWFVGAAVAAAVVVAGHFVADRLVFGRPAGETPLPKPLLRAQAAQLGPVGPVEWAAIAGLAFFLAGAGTVSLHHVPLSQIAALLLTGLLLFGLVGKAAFQKKIDWAMIFFLLSLDGLTETMNHLGIAEQAVAGLGGWAEMLHGQPVLFLLVEFAVVMAIRLVLPITAGMVTAALLLMPLAPVVGISPWVIGFLAGLFSDIWVMPYQSSQYVQFRGAEGGPNGRYDEAAFLRHNAILGAFRLAAGLASLPYWDWLGLL